MDDALGHLQFLELTGNTWPSLETLFGEKGACGGCWCMTWRLKSKDYERLKGAGNKRAFKRLATSGHSLGIIATIAGDPVAWCSVSPRDELVRLENSRILSRIDENPVWSITCLFIKKEYRRKGLSAKLISAAADYAKSKGATIVEGYPVLPKKQPIPDVFAFTGVASAFLEAGFVEVARRSPTRPIMRKVHKKV